MRQTRFDWLALKTRKKAVPNKNKPGRKEEHTLALLENERRNICKELEVEQTKVLATDGGKLNADF